MKRRYVLTAGTLLLGALATACATGHVGAPQPHELEFARSAYERTEAGPAAAVAPEELRDARIALDQAEQAYRLDPNSAAARDLAYLAERRAEIVEAQVGITLAQWRIDVARRLRALPPKEAAAEGKRP